MSAEYPPAHAAVEGELLGGGLALLTKGEEYSDWSHAWEVAVRDTPVFPYDADQIVEVVKSSEGENDGPNWIALLRMTDGKIVLLDAGCDYTGWGCQDGGQFRIFESMDDALSPVGLNNSARARFGYPEIEVKPWTCDHTTRVSDASWRCPECKAELR